MPDVISTEAKHLRKTAAVISRTLCLQTRFLRFAPGIRTILNNNGGFLSAMRSPYHQQTNAGSLMMADQLAQLIAPLRPFFVFLALLQLRFLFLRFFLHDSRSDIFPAHILVTLVFHRSVWSDPDIHLRITICTKCDL